MTKVLLLLLLCLAYQATAAIILTPVTFATDPVPVPAPTPAPVPASIPAPIPASIPAPVPEPATPKVQTASSSDATPQQGTIPTPADNGIIIVPEGLIPSAMPLTNPSTSRDENRNHLDYSSRYEQTSSEKKNSDKKDKPEAGANKSKNKSKRQIMVNPDRSIVLMKEFPQNNAILPNSNVDSAEKTIVLQTSGQFELSFYVHTVASQVSQAIEELTLIVTLNGKETDIPLTSGTVQKSVVLEGEEGPNQLVFSLQGKDTGKGLVSVVLTQFKVA